MLVGTARPETQSSEPSPDCLNAQLFFYYRDDSYNPDFIIAIIVNYKVNIKLILS